MENGASGESANSERIWASVCVEADREVVDVGGVEA